MKNIFFTFFLIYIVEGISYGQNFNAYLSGGIVTSQVSGDALGGFDKAGVETGIGVSTPVAKKMAMAFELTYIQKGSRKPSKLDQGDISQYLLRLNYLEVPITINYQLNDKFDVYLGASAGYLISSLEENENGEIFPALPFKSTDISVIGGAEYRFGKHLKANLRGLQSVLPVREFGGQVNSFVDAGQYNSVFVLMVNYYFKPLEK
ncbi:MAG: outer membrane beta-barrel protein [Bacteroidota bacterium]